jgi:beta-galactosidase
MGVSCGAVALERHDADNGAVWPNQAWIEPRLNRPTLFVNGEAVPPIAYMSYLGETRFYREVADAGIHLYCFPAYLGDRGINTNSGIGPFRTGIWKGEEEFDFSSIESDFSRILAADAQALVVIRLHLDPPAWWERAHPEGCCWLPDGSTLRQCFASPVWRDAATRSLRRCLDWLRASPYARHVIGIHVAAGFTEEWFYHFRELFHDENPARLLAFRNWLRRTYQDDEASLRAAWQAADVDFENAVPADIGGARREAIWYGAKEHRARFDTVRFHTELMTDNIMWFCREVKEHSERRLLTGAFYGYHYFVTDVRRGHGALGPLLACSDLDYLSSPNVYNRVLGEDWPPMAAHTSIHRHGKLWLAENDTRTALTTPLKDRAPHICPPGQYESGVWLGPTSMEDSVALLRANTTRMLAHGYGGWWFDMWGGWFSDPQFLRVLRQSLEFARLNLTHRVTGMDPQVAVVVDETLAFQDGSFGLLAERILGNRYALGKCGASYDLLLRGDLCALDDGRHRFIWLLGVPALTETEREILERRLQTGAHVLHTGFHDTVLRRADQEDVLMAGKVTFPRAELRMLYREATVHQYVDGDDVVHSGNGWLGIHSSEGGARTVRLPLIANVRDAFTDRDMALGVDQLDIVLQPRSTLLLRITPA